MVETNAGIGISASDEDYIAAGATIVKDPKEIFAKATQEAVDNGSMISTWYNQHLISVASVDEVIDEGAAVIAVTDMREASKIAGWIYECIEKPEDNNSNEGE